MIKLHYVIVLAISVLILGMHVTKVKACEHEREIVLKTRDYSIECEEESIVEFNTAIINDESLRNVFAEYSILTIYRLFDLGTNGKIQTSVNPAGHLVAKPSRNNTYILKLTDKSAAESLVEVLKTNSQVVYAHLNRCVEYQSPAVNDPMYPSQWELKNTGQAGGTPGVDINIEEAWEYSEGSESVKVAVIDGRIESILCRCLYTWWWLGSIFQLS
jgi:hypothetical protein